MYSIFLLFRKLAFLKFFAVLHIFIVCFCLSTKDLWNYPFWIWFLSVVLSSKDESSRTGYVENVLREACICSISFFLFSITCSVLALLRRLQNFPREGRAPGWRAHESFAVLFVCIVVHRHVHVWIQYVVSIFVVLTVVNFPENKYKVQVGEIHRFQ